MKGLMTETGSDSDRREGGLRLQGMRRASTADRPLVTVITVVFNGAGEIEETIRSVIQQTYDNVEYIVIDGGSTDGTLEIIGKYGDAIDHWVSEPDRGIYDAMNKGIRLAQGEWLNFMNAGDLFSAKDVVARIFSEPGNYRHSDFIYSDTLFRGRSGVRLYRCDIAKRLVIHQSIIYRKELHAMSGDYLVARNLTISDYLFFMINIDKRWFKFGTPICTYFPYGVSSGLATFRQKVAVDVMLGFTGRFRGALLLAAHPVYAALRKLFRR
jgi:glycosyltransferase involved in cell wall biosynthesis